MRWLDCLPSVGVDRRCQLPDCPGIYFLAFGSSIYYVGKAFNIRQRHSSENNHDIYSYLNQISPNLRGLFRIKWITFADITISGYLLDELLLGYEDYMIKTLCPRWNRRQNGIKLSDAIVHSITNKIMSISLSEGAESITAASTPTCPSSQSEYQKPSQYSHDDELLALAKEHAECKKDKSKNFIQKEWNIRENPKIQEFFLNINSYSKEETSPTDLILLGLTLIAQKVNQYGLLMEIDEDLSILEKFLPETVRYPKLLEIAKDFLEMYPDMKFDDLIQRCTGRLEDDICPLDWAALNRIYTKHNDTLAVPATGTELRQPEQNSVLSGLTKCETDPVVQLLSENMITPT